MTAMLLLTATLALELQGMGTEKLAGTCLLPQTPCA